IDDLAYDRGRLAVASPAEAVRDFRKGSAVLQQQADQHGAIIDDIVKVSIGPLGACKNFLRPVVALKASSDMQRHTAMKRPCRSDRHVGAPVRKPSSHQRRARSRTRRASILSTREPIDLHEPMLCCCPTWV